MISPYHHDSRYTRRQGFTLIELLTVIAIIGILAGILIPTVQAARKSANRAKSKAQFNQYALALQQYRTEYGYWPAVGTLNTGGEVNLNGNSVDFIRALSARNPTTNAVDRTLNRRGAAFISFSESEFLVEPNGTVNRTQLVDAFNNPNIRVKVDHDNDGRVTGLPNVDGIGSEINAKVAIWTLRSDGVGQGFEDVYSWN